MRLKYIIIPSFSMLLLWSINSCSKSTNYSSPPVVTPPVVVPTISVQVKTDSHFGSVITDSNGRTLYFFSPDVKGNSVCTGTCITNWPAFYVPNPTLGTGLADSDFATISRPDASKQTTYKGWPLYYFAGDAAAGGITGDGVAGLFFVAKPDYTVMLGEGQLIGNDAVLYDSTYHPATGNTLYMTTDRGVTLYRFSIDKADSNKFTKSDFSNDATFPIFQISTIQNVPSVFNKTDFSSITVFGKPQMTYRGWPVYRFGADSLIRGNTKAVSVPTPGFWPVMDASTTPLAPQ